MKEMNWKEEARKQASAAGEIKIKIAFRLSEINSRLLSLRKDVEAEEDPNIIYCILNRISIYEEEKRWLKSIFEAKG